MKNDDNLNVYKRWKQSQRYLVEWRNNNYISDEDAMPNFDDTVLWLTQYFQRGRLLEVGCRTGGLRKSRYLYKAILYTGIDPLRDPSYDYDFNYKCVDAESFVDPGHKFDCVLIRDSFDYFYDPLKALANIMRMLRPGGLLLISEGGHKGRFHHIKHLARLLMKRLSSIIRLSRGNHASASCPPFMSPCNTHLTYPNGDLSSKEIVRLLKKSKFKIVKNTIYRGRLRIVCASNCIIK